MGSPVLKSLSILLGLFFIFVGIIKISSAISKELHKDLRKEYVKYAKVFPLADALNFKIPSKWYRRTVGVLEIVFGAALAFYPNHADEDEEQGEILRLERKHLRDHSNAFELPENEFRRRFGPSSDLVVNLIDDYLKQV